MRGDPQCVRLGVERPQIFSDIGGTVIRRGGEGITEARRRKADLLESRAAGERSFVAHNVLKSAAVMERESLSD